MQTIDAKLVNFFNSYLFRNVWNEPGKEYRQNIKPKLVSTPIANTSVKLYWSRYALPTAEKYQVYYIPESTMGGLTFKDFPDWTNCVDFLNSSRMELRFHNNDGITLPREKVYIANHPEANGVLIAVKRSLFRDIYGASADYTDLYVAFYYDSNVPNDVQIVTYTMDGGTDVNTVYNATLNATSVYVNGKATIVNSVADISVSNAIVEIVTDNNVIGEFEIDLTTANGQRNFISDLDGIAKTIIHIPKSINAANKVITHHTCDIWIYPRNGVTANRNGRFLHRAIEDFSFSQITHNDFAIPDAIINSYVDTLNTDSLKLVVQVKDHSGNNNLINDVNYIGLLYTHDDETILDFLEGVGPEDFDFWKAETLESSEYARMMVDTPDFIDVANLPTYIGALGYYNSIALISNRVKTIVLEEVEGEVSHRFLIPIPVVFESIRIFPSMFLNGERLPQNTVTVSRIVNGSIVVDIDDSIILSEGDIVKVELFEDVPHNIREIRPTATYNHIDVSDNDFVLYEVVEPPSPVEGIDESYDYVYIRIDDLSSIGAYIDSLGGRYIAFNPSSYGRIFVLAHNTGFEYRSYNLDPLLETNQPLAFDLKTTIKSIAFEPPYEWVDHISKDSISGEVVDPIDPDAEVPYPAWHLMDGDETWNSDYRWITTLIPEGNKVKFNLDPTIQGNYYLIGYRIGAMPNMGDAARAAAMPINWQVRVDGILKDSVTNEWWYQNPEVVHTHMLLTPVLVNTEIEFSLSGIQTSGAFQIQTDLFEPIFSSALENTVIPYLGKLTCIPYLNGKELVKDIDYYLADIQYDGEPNPHMCGRQLVINNAAYLEESDNILEVILTYCDVDGKTEGYVEDEYLNDLGQYPRWYDQLSILAVEGSVTENTSTLFGTIQIPLLSTINDELKAYYPFNGDMLNDTTENFVLIPSVGSVVEKDLDTNLTGLLVPSTIEDVDITMPMVLPDNYTVCASIRVNDPTLNTQEPLFGIGGFPAGGIQIRSLNNLWGLYYDTYYVPIAIPITDQPIHFAIVVENQVDYKLYVDGVLVIDSNVPSPRTANIIRLGGVNNNGTYFYDMMFFHRALPLEDILKTINISDKDQFRLGSPYGTRTLIPAKSKYFIDRYYADDDTPKLDALTDYFRGLNESYDNTILLEYSHRLVSIRAHMVVRDMIEGSLVVPYDPSDQVILDAISDYDYLKQYDVLFNDDSAVNLDYIDFQAMYTEQDIQNGTLLQQINRVIQVLIKDSATYLRPGQEG